MSNSFSSEVSPIAPFVPKKITIEEYRRRKQEQLKDHLQREPTAGPKPRELPVPKEKEHTDPTAKRRHRAGRKVRVRQELGTLFRLAAISTGAEKRAFLKKAHVLQRQEFMLREEKRRQKWALVSKKNK